MSDGEGCVCYAYSESECGCGVDWTEQIVYDLRDEVAIFRNALNDLLNDCINFDDGTLTPVFMENASNVLKRGNK
jgi:hypothetical protein